MDADLDLRIGDSETPSKNSLSFHGQECERHGRYISVQRTSQLKEPMQICEIMAFGGTPNVSFSFFHHARCSLLTFLVDFDDCPGKCIPYQFRNTVRLLTVLRNELTESFLSSMFTVSVIPTPGDRQKLLQL